MVCGKSHPSSGQLGAQLWSSSPTTSACWRVSLINELLHRGEEWGREAIAQTAHTTAVILMRAPSRLRHSLSVGGKVSLGRGSAVSSPRPQIPQCAGREGALPQSLAPWSAVRLYPVLARRLGPRLLCFCCHLSSFAPGKRVQRTACVPKTNLLTYLMAGIC